MTTTQTATDAIASLEAARLQAGAWLGRPLLSECVDPETGDLTPAVVVTDNGPAYKSAAIARQMAAGRSSRMSAPATAHPARTV